MALIKYFLKKTSIEQQKKDRTSCARPTQLFCLPSVPCFGKNGKMTKQAV